MMKIGEEKIHEKIDIISNEICNKKGEKIVNINFKKINNSPCDFFIICSGKSNRQIQSISKSVEKKVFEKLKIKPWQTEGKNSDWILIDYSDVIVHIFKAETREHYDLESLWGDGKIKKYNCE